MMGGSRFIPNNNKPVTRMLSREFGRYNKGRNRILMLAVSLCIVTLTMVFGISFGKVQAEYLKAVRAAGTTASAYIEDASQLQYEIVQSLEYVKQAGRYAQAGEAAAGDDTICKLRVLDAPAWEKIIKPAYTDIHGHYPENKQEIMLSIRTLEKMGITRPREGSKIPFTVNIGLFRTEQEEFYLSGWYTDYADSHKASEIGYISQDKYKGWGYDIQEEANILICQSDNIDWRELEERLYQDVPSNDKAPDKPPKITTNNTFSYDAVNRMTGGYGMAVLGALVILSGMFFLIHNVMQISMAGDIRQMGLLNTVGATRKQICKIYFGQIRDALIPGVMLGTVLSAFVLLIGIPNILGRQYLSRYGGAGGLRIFRPEFLAASIIFTALLTAGAAAGVIYRLVNTSCVESIYYTNPESKKSKKTQIRVKYKKRSVTGELWYMAWQNLTRQKGRFLLTVFSLFLGMEAFLGSVVITKGSDYAHMIETRPDFLIAGEFSEWGQEAGYGLEYKSRDAGEDPMKTEGNNFYLLDENDYDEFSPVSAEVREKLLGLDGVDRDKSYVMEGAYMISTISQKGIRPLTDNLNVTAEVKDGVGYSKEYAMIEGFDADVIQILHEEEIAKLRQYVEKNRLSTDMDSLENGTGVVIIHDHQLSPKQIKAAEESVGEPLYFTRLRSKEERMRWNKLSPKERDAMREPFGEIKQSEMLTISGYLDNQAEGFPYIRQTWHGSEGAIYYFISEKGFEKLPTEKKTLYMELGVDEEKEQKVKAAIQDIVYEENQRRNELPGTGGEEKTGEAGIFCISKSDLLLEAANEIQGNRMILGSISAVLLFAGLTNYFNIMITGILSRRKELAVMESVGMTKRQKKKLLAAEGLYYCLAVAVLMLTVGSGILRLIGQYMQKKLSYFVFCYPIGWMILLISGLAGICFLILQRMSRAENLMEE